MPRMRQREAHQAVIGSGGPVEERNGRRTTRHATRPLQLQLRLFPIELRVSCVPLAAASALRVRTLRLEHFIDLPSRFEFGCKLPCARSYGVTTWYSSRSTGNAHWY
jgi:hypothetical protein